MTLKHRRVGIAFLWVGLIVPLAILALAASVIAVWLPQTPDPAAIHWDASGPDGFGPRWMNLVIPIGLGAGLVVAFAALALFTGRFSQPAEGAATLLPRSQNPAVATRFLAAVNLGMSAMMALIALTTVGVQRGLADAHDAPDITWAMLIGFVVLASGTTLGWFLQPKSPLPNPSAGPGAAPLSLNDGARAAWFGTAVFSRSALIILGLMLFGSLALGVALLAVDQTGGWVTIGIMLALLVLVFFTVVFRVRADASGLHVRSVFGWPRYAVPADEIISVRVVTVNPLAEFGGWGIRWGVDGRFGIVLRTGEGIEVARTNGKIMVVTIDDAATAAAVLSAAASATKDHA